MDPSIESLVSRAEHYAKSQGLALSTVSLRIFNDGKRLDALKEGAGLTFKRFAKADTELSRLEREMQATEALANTS